MKVHLLIEEELTDILVEHCELPEYLDKARLTFYQKIQLLRALHGNDTQGNPTEQPWEALEYLNTIRNKMAHHLEPKDLDRKIESFINSFGVGNKDFKCIDEKKTTQTLRLALCMLSGFVGGFWAVKSQPNKALQPPSKSGAAEL